MFNWSLSGMGPAFRTMLFCFFGFSVGMSSDVRASGVVITPALFRDAAERAALIATLRDLSGKASNLQALERLLSYAGQDLVSVVGANVVYTSHDPDQQEVYLAVATFRSVELIEAALAEGSPLAVEWALRKALHQAMNSMLDRNPLYEQMRTGGQIIDGQALERLKPHILRLAADGAGPIRTLAVESISELGLGVDRTALKLQLQDSAVNRRIDALRGLGVRYDRQVEAFVWETLSTSPDFGNFSAADREIELLKSCLRFVGGALPEIPENRFETMERLAVSRDSTVRETVAQNLVRHAMPGNPRMSTVLQKLASDPVARVAASARSQLAYIEAASAKELQAKQPRPDSSPTLP